MDGLSKQTLYKIEDVIADLLINPGSIYKSIGGDVRGIKLQDAQDQWKLELCGYIKESGRWFVAVRTPDLDEDHFIMTMLHKTKGKFWIYFSNIHEFYGQHQGNVILFET